MNNYDLIESFSSDPIVTIAICEHVGLSRMFPLGWSKVG